MSINVGTVHYLPTGNDVDTDFDTHQEMLRDSVRRFLADQAPMSFVRSMMDDPAGITHEVWNGLAELGETGMLVPEEYGGAGMGMVDLAPALEEMGRSALPGPFRSHAVGAVSLMVLAGSGDDHARWLPDMASGASKGTVAVIDNTRMAAAQSSTIATLDSDTWKITGTTVHVPDGVCADLLLISADTADGDTGIFVVPNGTDGLTVSPLDTVDQTQKFSTVICEGVIGERLGGTDAPTALAVVQDRLGVAAVLDGLGAASVALNIAVDYAKERRQFDRPIGSFQAVQHLCADMLQTIELGRAAVYYATWACDSADATERHRAVTMAQAFSADAFYAIGASAIQVLGGVGFTWDHDIHIYYKRLLTLSTAAGGTTGQLEELASIVLDG